MDGHLPGLTSKNNKITGKSSVGGNSGDSGWTTDDNLLAQNNTIEGITNVGGCIGYASHYYSDSNNIKSEGAKQIISGQNYVGGTIGRSKGKIKNAKAEECTIKATGSYGGGIVGCSEYSTTSISTSNNSNFAIAGAKAKKVNLTVGLNYAGGIVGYQVGSVYGTVLEDSIITANGTNAGGIAGFYTGYVGSSAGSISSSNFFLMHSYSANSTVKAQNNAGGIVGRFVFGNIQYCYVANTNVIASKSSSGGLVGYFDNSKLSNIQYKGTIKYNFVANTENDKTISGANSVGGLVGTLAKNLNYDEDIEKYNNIECNLVVTDVSSNGLYVDMGCGSVAGTSKGTPQGKYMNNIYVYDCSTLNKVQVGGITEEKENLKMISSGELKTNIYTKNTKIIDEEGYTVGNEGLNFGNTRYSYTDGYFPILKTSGVAELYWDSNRLNVIQNKIPIPSRTAQFSMEDEVSLDEANLSVMSLEELQDSELPEVFVYAVDVDKINIEFRNSNYEFDSKFKITSNDKTIVELSNIETPVYTLEYDFNTPLEIDVLNSSYSYKKTINPEEVRSMLSIIDDEYMYLSEGKVCSNKRTLNGEYCNLYKEKMLDKNGNIYDVKTANNIGKIGGEIHLLEEPIPLQESMESNTKIQTFAHCSKVTQNDGKSIFKSKQIFVKNGYMYVVDGKMNNKNGLALIDCVNNKQYETILGEDGMLYNLLTEIKYPENFKNNEIVAMTGNMDQTSDITMLYYSNGKVLAFNYVTGEVKYENEVEDEKVSLLSYIGESFSVKNIAYKIEEKDYQKAQELENKLNKVSIDEASEKISKDINTNSLEEKNSVSEGSNFSNKNNTETSRTNDEALQDIKDGYSSHNKYVTTYDPSTQSYVVYSTAELIEGKTPITVSENEKINGNKDLISYYSNVSNSTDELKSFGGIAIFVILGSICVILIVLYKKTNR